MNEIFQTHTPVMLERTLELLTPALKRPGAVAVDATLGLGGHSAALLEQFPDLTVIGVDRDRDALKRASERLRSYSDRFIAVHGVFDDIATLVRERGFTAVDGVLFDLGVSSMQLDRAERGFAYAQDAPLDMRMDQSTGQTAAQLLAGANQDELRNLFRELGDEPLAGRYAAAIVRARDEAPLERSQQLVDVLQEATPAKLKNKRHPAKRVFQALRVAVNDEIAATQGAIPAALGLLRLSGRIVVMAYQSHEDRIVKHRLRDASSSTTPQGLPVELPEHQPEFKLLTRGAERADEHEQQANPRSIPARLRAAERVRETA
jgi:16S rRNA (cytosine1402-N4)-methyltransferase